MNNFLGEIGKYYYLYQVKLTDIKHVTKDDYEYFFYTFVGKDENTIIAKEKKKLVYYYTEYTCSLTGGVIKGSNSDKWKGLVRVEIIDGKLLAIPDRHKISKDQLDVLFELPFSDIKRVNFYNPITTDLHCFTGENKTRNVQTGDYLTGPTVMKTHKEFQGVKQSILNVTDIIDLVW